MFTVRIEDSDGIVATWDGLEAVPYAVDDAVIVDGQLYEITGRTWTGPQDLALAVADPLAVSDTAGKDKP